MSGPLYVNAEGYEDEKMPCPFCINGHTRQYQMTHGVKTEVDSYLCYECNGSSKCSKKVFTCYGCPEVPNCKCAYDNYNTNGDCLMGK